MTTPSAEARARETATEIVFEYYAVPEPDVDSVPNSLIRDITAALLAERERALDEAKAALGGAAMTRMELSCGMSAINGIRFTTRWSRVTCKRCLKKKSSK